MVALARSPCIARPSAFPPFLPLSIFRCTRSLPLCIFLRRRSRSFWPRRARFLACRVPDVSPSVPPTSCQGKRGRRNGHTQLLRLAHPIAIALTHPRNNSISSLTATVDVSPSSSVFWKIRKSMSLSPNGSPAGSSTLAADCCRTRRKGRQGGY